MKNRWDIRSFIRRTTLTTVLDADFGTLLYNKPVPSTEAHQKLGLEVDSGYAALGSCCSSAIALKLYIEPVPAGGSLMPAYDMVGINFTSRSVFVVVVKDGMKELIVNDKKTIKINMRTSRHGTMHASL